MTRAQKALRALQFVERLEERAQDGSFTLSFDKQAGQLAFSCKRATSRVYASDSAKHFLSALSLLLYQAEKDEAMREARRTENDR